MLRHPSSVNTICSSPCLAMPYLLTVSQDASARLYLTAAWNEPPQLLHAAPEQPSTLSAAASAFSPTGLYAAMAISEAPWLMLWRLADGLLNRFSQPAQDAAAALLTGVTGRDSATSAAPASARATIGASTLATAIASTAASTAAAAAAAAAASASASNAYPATAVVARRAAAAAAAAAAARVASSTSGSSTGSTSAPFSLTKLAGHDGEVTNIYFSPRGNALLSGSRDGTARIWEWLGRPERGNVRVRVLAPSQDGHEEALASTSGNKPPVLWIDMVGWSNDGNFVFTAESLRKQVRLSHIMASPTRHTRDFSHATPQPSDPSRPTLPTHVTRHAVTQTREETCISACVRIWSPRGRQLQLIRTGTDLSFVMRSHPVDPRLLCIASYGGSISLWDLWQRKRLSHHEVRKPLPPSTLSLPSPSPKPPLALP